MVGDKTQGQRGLIVRVEIGPFHCNDNRLALANDIRHPGGEHVPYDDALIAPQAINLLDGVLAEQAARLRQGGGDWPIIDAASDAPIITPGAPLASDIARLA